MPGFSFTAKTSIETRSSEKEKTLKLIEQKLKSYESEHLNILTVKICLLSDWGGVCLCVESAPLGALVRVIVRNVE